MHEPPNSRKRSNSDSTHPSKKAKSSKHYFHSHDDTWVYGYHLKNKHYRRLAEKVGRSWDEDPWTVETAVSKRLAWEAYDVPYKSYLATIRGRYSGIIGFMEDDERKRLRFNSCSPKEMDKVRRILGFPKGQKPKWYNCSVEDDCSSEDEDPPPALGSDRVDPDAPIAEGGGTFAPKVVS